MSKENQSTKDMDELLAFRSGLESGWKKGNTHPREYKLCYITSEGRAYDLVLKADGTTTLPTLMSTRREKKHT